MITEHPIQSLLAAGSVLDSKPLPADVIAQAHSRAMLYAFAGARFTLTSHEAGSYRVWERQWKLRGQHQLIMLRLVENNIGADIVIGSCSASYGAHNQDWRQCNIGVARSAEDVKPLYQWMASRAES